MVVGFVDSREHARSIGFEQGGIPQWDDIVVEHHDGSYEHVQVKRQDTDFDGVNPITRSTITKGKRKGEFQDRSPLDEAITSLANHFSTQNGITNGPIRKFTLAIPHSQIEIKKNLLIRHLTSLCIECRKQGASGAGLELRANGDPTTKQLGDQSTQQLFEWLTTWCDFTSWDHIFDALSRLTISLCGNESV